jgi:hypothetical protein
MLLSDKSFRVCVAIAVQNAVDFRIVRRDSHLFYPHVSDGCNKQAVRSSETTKQTTDTK